MSGPSESAPPPHDVSWVWYFCALVVYVGLAVATLSLRDNVVLLNWIVGPLFPVLVLYAVPQGVRAVMKRAQNR